MIFDYRGNYQCQEQLCFWVKGSMRSHKLQVTSWPDCFRRARPWIWSPRPQESGTCGTLLSTWIRSIPLQQTLPVFQAPILRPRCIYRWNALYANDTAFSWGHCTKCCTEFATVDVTQWLEASNILSWPWAFVCNKPTKTKRSENTSIRSKWFLKEGIHQTLIRDQKDRYNLYYLHHVNHIHWFTVWQLQVDFENPHGVFIEVPTKAGLWVFDCDMAKHVPCSGQCRRRIWSMFEQMFLRHVALVAIKSRVGAPQLSMHRTLWHGWIVCAVLHISSWRILQIPKYESSETIV